ncbi:hypothetical protein MYCTH_2310474 [Thermothelomyces thermophilus ATCC 42464]|uniref:Uncharacterized protein n=1 Tax=Thermothelomyces thermophilus (strain ATCC 42464 / BCRC 31852 / DSM 1799) TaxID=573729 RepID=G2QLK2_THET4|nr:uncharacterized protein MYCTH_2310474 [Thermothelomyces thermophilus ATCC 42464]AEO60832.1 hypothetical protein MYCTH_2310474 [Thermothelomyces thermophilus ATCC 42464]
MSPTSSLVYSLLVPKPQPPPYNRLAKLTMTVEVETVALQPDKATPAPPSVGAGEGGRVKRG